MTDLLEKASVRRVRTALEAAGADTDVVVLSSTARTAEDAASSLGVAVGAIVKSLVFTIGERPVLALIAGDRRCDADALGPALGLEGRVRRADADRVREATGFSIGGVAPLGHPAPLPTLIDSSLGRYSRVYAAAGHPHCVFPTTLDDLVRITGGQAADGISVAAKD